MSKRVTEAYILRLEKQCEVKPSTTNYITYHVALARLNHRLNEEENKKNKK